MNMSTSAAPSWVTAVRAVTPLSMKNCRSSRTPESRRSMSPVRRVEKYDIGSESSLAVRKSRLSVSIRTATKAKM